jgi:single stranded DNA-binding protein
MTIEVALFGVLGRDAESKVSKSGKAYLRLNIRSGDGDAAQWINAMIFGDDVPEFAPRLAKGARVYVEGSLKLDEWTAQDGTKRHGLSVMSWHCRLAEIGRNKPKRESDDSKRRAAATSAPTSAADDRQGRVRGIADASMDDEIPFGPEWR